MTTQAVRAAEPHLRGSRTKRRSRTSLFGAVVMVLMIGLGIGLLTAGSKRSPSASAAGPQHSGVIDFTTYSPPSVQRVTYLYEKGKLTLGTPTVVTRLQNADGLAFTPSGQLVVGGQSSGLISVMTPSGSPVASIRSGVPAAFLVSIAPSGKALYTAGLPGLLSEVPLDPPADGHPVALKGDDSTITDLAFGPNNQAIYTASTSEGQGNIGLIDLRSASTHRLLTNVVGAHGIMYDRYTGSYLVIGGNSVLQLPADNPGQIVSELTMPGMQFDQGAVTGQGIAFFASNTGDLVMVDYTATGRIGDVHNVVRSQFLASHLDDVAPLTGPGARPVPAGTSAFRRAGEASLGGAVVVALLLVVGRIRRPRGDGPVRRKGKRLPRWDKRRNSSQTTNWVSGPIDDLDLFG